MDLFQNEARLEEMGKEWLTDLLADGIDQEKGKKHLLIIETFVVYLLLILFCFRNFFR